MDVIKSLFAILILTSFALAQNQPPARTAAGCGPGTVQFHVKADKTKHSIAQSDSGKAVVYVLQVEKRDVGAWSLGATTTRVGLDGRWKGANHGQTYISFSVDPGEHHLCTDWQSSLRQFSKLCAAATVTAEPGKIYYFRTRKERNMHLPLPWNRSTAPKDSS